MNAIRIVVAEDNMLTRDMLVESLCEEPDMTVVATAVNGLEALNILQAAVVDVLVLDLVMPRMDGYALMDRMRTVARKPRMIVLTSLGRGDFISRAVALGADDYMLKPFDAVLLKERIRMLAEAVPHRAEPHHPVREGRVSAADNITKYVTSMLLTAGVPAHVCGYQYLREAIMMVVNSPERAHGMTQHLYPTIARRFETTPSRVERSIRNAIDAMWNRGTPDTLERAFGRNAGKMLTKPSNGELIALAAERIRIKTGA